MALYYNFALISVLVGFCEAPVPPNPKQHYQNMLHNIVHLNKKRIEAFHKLTKLNNQDVMKLYQSAEFNNNILRLKDRLLLIPEHPTARGFQKENNVVFGADRDHSNEHIAQQILRRLSRFRKPSSQPVPKIFLVNKLSHDKEHLIKHILKPRYESDDWSDVAPNEAVHQAIVSQPQLITDDRERDSGYIRYDILPIHLDNVDDSNTLLDENVGAEEVDDDLDIFKKLDLSPEEANMLRKSWRGSCDKKAQEICKKACKKAVSNFCSSYVCKSNKKKFFKKQCGRSCKKKFFSSKSDSDSES